MINHIKSYMLKHKDFFKIIIFVKMFLNDAIRNIKTKKNINKVLKEKNHKIFYFGVPVHSNLGDLAQGICIRRWIHKNYPNHQLVEIETNAIVNTHFSILHYLKKVIKKEDIIIFQSGYTTTDLGGYADIMHKAVIKAFPCNRIIMMPQTIFFKSKDRKKDTSLIYNSHKKMLFLARDRISFEMAKEMFPDIPAKCYPDIVTTLIGSYPESNDRNGIVFCLRDDSEKFYSDKDLEVLIKNCKKFTTVDRTDTTKNSLVLKDAKNYIDSEIEKYSKYKVMITDRYHGTILSLIAGTPVIIIKTKDHKVVTGADWFKGVYDEYVYLAKDLDDAYIIAKSLYKKNLSHKMKPHFEKEYYDKLPKLVYDLLGEI